MSASLQPVPGDGLLAHCDGLVLLWSAPDAQAALVDALVAAHTEVAAAADAAALADRITALLPADIQLSVVVFGLAGASLLVAVRGHAWANVVTDQGEQTLVLRDARELVRSTIPGAVISVRAGLGELDLTAAPARWVSLGAGVVGAGGLVYTASRPVVGEPAPAATPGGDAMVDTAQLPNLAPPGAPAPLSPLPAAAEPQTVDRSAAFSSVVLIHGGGSRLPPDETPRAPLAVVTAPPPPAAPDVAPAAHPVDEGGVHVLGVYCKNGHFDDPSARYCAICGISMAQLTLVPRTGSRPPLGVLVLDDGSIFSLDTDYVIGRDPSQNHDVVSGAARPMRFEDTEGRLSRQHVRIVLDGWQVNVVDLGSANGTGVKGPADSEWRTIPPRTTVPIKPGTQVGLGRRKFRYESHRNT